MAEILPAPPRLRASRLSGFSCFHALQWKPCAMPSFSPVLLPRRRTGFRVLSRLDSDSDSDFGLISTAKCSDGSTVFKFGNTKDRETVIAGVDVGKANEAAAATEVPKKADGKKIKKKTKSTARKVVVSRSERRQSSSAAEVSREVKTVVGGDSSEAPSLTVGISDSNLSRLDSNEVPLSSNDDVKDAVVAKGATLEVNVATGKDIAGNSARIRENDAIMDSISSELESAMDIEESADMEIASFASVGIDNGNGNTAENASTEMSAKAPLEEETGYDTNVNISEIISDGTPNKAPQEKETVNSNVIAVENVSAEIPADAPHENEAGNNGNVNVVEEVSDDTPYKAPLKKETGKNSNVNAVENVSAEMPADALQENEAENNVNVDVNVVEEVSDATPYKAPLEKETGNNSNVNALENVSSKTPADAPQENEAGNNGNVNVMEEVSTGTPAKAPLERETEPSSVNGHVDADDNRNQVQLDHNRSCANEEEAGTSEEEEIPAPVVECHSIEDTPNREDTSTGFLLSSGAVSLHHTSEGLGGVGDAYFVAENWLGVADGVGHWTLEGVSDALFTREIVENCEKNISQGSVDPRDVLIRSVAETGSPGSSTILIGHFDGQAFHVVNVGDSGFMVIRDGVVFQKSSPVVHEFNFPLHVESGHDPSEHIEAYKINLDEGDLIVTATDGLFDNLYDHDILSIVSESLTFSAKPQDIAESLATKALEMGRSSSSRSPFADAAQAAGYAGYSGGKLDDVVVIVSLVQTKHTT